MRLRVLIACLGLLACQEEAANEPESSPVTSGGTEDAGDTSGEGSGDGESDGDDKESPPPTETAKPTTVEANRFLMQASFGPAPGDAAEVEAMGYAAWIEAQAALPTVPYLPRLEAMDNPRSAVIADLFWESAIEGDDQLRARMAYALSNIVTVSYKSGVLTDHPETFAHYHDILNRQAFGNYTDLIREVSLSPAMGDFLSHVGNRRADEEAGIAPDENYARELMQLFTIGLEELNPDGTPKGSETYDTDDVLGLAAVFTGLSWADTNFERPQIKWYNRAVPMESFRAFHEPGPKTFLGATVDVGGEALSSVDAALDHLLNHPNLAPFVSKQLIQHLVTSNPSPAYVARVGAAFEAGRYAAQGKTFGEGRRGDLLATAAAILLDQEARDPAAAAQPGFGRVRDSVLRFTHLTRAFRDDVGASRIGAPQETGAMRFAERPDILGQAPLAPPSVFGWYRPGYVSPGGWAARNGAVSPEMQIATGSNMAGYVDWMARTIRSDIWGGTDFFDLDVAEIAPLAEKPVELVDALDLRLTAGSMEQSTKDRIAETLELITVDEKNTEKDREHRLRLALLMAVTSTEYAVQR